MKILHVLPTLHSSYGGPVQVAKVMREGLEKLGHQVDIFPIIEPSNHIAHNQGSVLYWPGLREIKYLANKIQTADIVHIHGLWTLPTSIAALISRYYSVPYIITPHGMLDKWSLNRSRIRKKIFARVVEKGNLSKSRALHFLNEDEITESREFIKHTSTFIVPNGIDISKFENLPVKSELLEQYPEASGKIIVLYLSRIHEKKGLDVLIPAMAISIESGLDLHLIIAGPDEGYKKMVLSIIDECNVQQNVSFAGEVSGHSKRVLYGGSDIFALTSYQEGDSVSIKEALASGLPVVITQACHLSEIERELSGIVCNPNPEDVSKALNILSKDNVLRKKMSKNAKNMIVGKYQKQTVIADLDRIYLDIASNTKNSNRWV